MQGTIGAIEIPASVIRSAQHTADAYGEPIKISKASESLSVNVAKADDWYVRGQGYSVGRPSVLAAIVFPDGTVSLQYGFTSGS